MSCHKKHEDKHKHHCKPRKKKHCHKHEPPRHHGCRKHEGGPVGGGLGCWPKN